MIDALIARIETWQPGYAAKLVGASPELLARIETRLGVPLWPEHRAFLERMGEDSNGLNAYDDAILDLRAPALLAFLDDDVGFDARALQIVGVSADLAVPLLMLDRRARTEPPPLVRVGFGDGETPAITAEHSSLAAMLLSFAFLTKCLPRHAWGLRLESPGTTRPRFPHGPPGRWLPHFAQLISALGFSALPETGPWCVCGERADAAVMIYECPGYAPDLRLAADDRRELARLSEILIDNLELRVRANSLRRPG